MWPLGNIDIGIDLGTSKFSVCVKGEGVIATESAYIAYQGEQLRANTIVAVGNAAEALVGRCPKGVQVMSPMKDGVIIDATVASLLLKQLMKQTGLARHLPRRRVLVGALLGASEIEKRAFIEVASSLGVSVTKTVSEPLAAAIGCGLPIDEPNAHMLVDIGSGATEIVVVSLGEVITGRSLRIGGDAMDAAISNHVLYTHKLAIGSQTAKAAKEWLSWNDGSESLSSLLLKGTDIQTRAPFAIKVGREEMQAAIDRPVQKIVDLVKSTFEKLCPEVSADLIENGIFLSGGGSLCPEIQKRIAKATDLDVKVAVDPSGAVVRGCNLMIQNYHLVS